MHTYLWIFGKEKSTCDAEEPMRFIFQLRICERINWKPSSGLLTLFQSCVLSQSARVSDLESVAYLELTI
ncbi:hypothetical protein VTL71DRAFT_2640 [Oculimacula yallundae]|uniref:Uncharacterized protein n=1 Tax=Oculimacula yallundae TaxID=86028 RepID=A0ABR4C9L7_9HELO